MDEETKAENKEDICNGKAIVLEGEADKKLCVRICPRRSGTKETEPRD